MDARSTGARNDYLLSLAAANSHQTRYFVIDLQNTILVRNLNLLAKYYHFYYNL